VGGSVEFVDSSRLSTAESTASATVAPTTLVERQVARDEALVGFVDSLNASRTITRSSSARLAKFDSATIDSLDQNSSDLLFELAAADKPIGEEFNDAYRPASQDDADIDSVDELFAEFDDDWVEIGVRG
jgi:hypothetical protein